MDDSDYIMRQIKSFAEGFGMMVGKKGAPKTEIVYEQQQNRNGKLYTQIDDLILHQKYEQAIQAVYAQKFIMDRTHYQQLGSWLVQRLKNIPEVDPTMLSEFIHNINKV